MNPFKTLEAVALRILGKKEFSVDEKGHLVLTAEEAEALNTRMVYAGGKFAESFKQSFDELADANAGGDHDKDEMITKAFIDTIRKDATAEIVANQEKIKAELEKDFAAKLEAAEALRQEAEKKASEVIPVDKEQIKAEVEKEVEQEFTAKLEAAEQMRKEAEQKAIELEKEKTRLEGENAILAAKTEEVKVETTGTGGAPKPAPFLVNRNHFHNRMAFNFLEGNTADVILAQTNNNFSNRHMMGGGPNNTIDVSELNSEFGTYLSDQARRLNIYKEILKPTQSRQYMTKIMAITEWRDAKVRIDSVVQQFIAKWTPLGKVKVTPIKIVNRRHKINLPIVPDDITGGYLMYLYNEGVTPDQMPVTQYIIEQLLRPRIEQDIEYKMVNNGVFDELDASSVTDGDAGQAPEKSMDGFLTILRGLAADPATTANIWTPTVAFTEDNSVQYFEDYAKWIKATNPTLAAVGMNVFCDPDMDETRRKKYREMFPYTKDSDMGSTKIDFSNLTIVPLENMRGSGIIFSTPKENFIELHHINEASGATNLFLQLQDYEVRVFGEFWLGVGFAVAEWIFASVPAATSGSGA